jgi:hypothetical protein
MKKKWHHHGKKVWEFFWESNSAWSWVANIIIAFLLIRYVVYPVLGIVLGTGYPIVAVVSESMDHSITPACVLEDKQNGVCLQYSQEYQHLCGERFSEFHDSYNHYWEICGGWYEENEISKEQFSRFPFQKGFYKGDVIVLWRANNLDVGDVLVFQGNKPQPIIHRIVKVWQEEGETFYQTKGDHNSDTIAGDLGEEKISEERVLGKGLFRIPYLGWMKIIFVDAVRPLGIQINR